MTAPDPLIVENLDYRYGGRQVLHNVSAAFGPGEMVGLVGPNGAGKSTLVRCLVGIQRAHAGRALLFGREAYGISARERAKHVAYVPQASPPAFPTTVFETCLLGRTPHLTSSARPNDMKIVEEYLHLLQLDRFAFRLLSELSGGERQRVMLARALAQETSLLVLDEPTSALDIRNQLFTLRVVSELVHDRGITAVVAIHDLAMAARFCDRLILLQDGRVRGAGKWEEILTEDSLREVYGIGAHIALQAGAPVFVPYEIELQDAADQSYKKVAV